MRPYLEKNHHKKGVVEWLKVKALSTNKKSKSIRVQSWRHCGGRTCGQASSGRGKRTG
jgi:hypothetical protein